MRFSKACIKHLHTKHCAPNINLRSPKICFSAIPILLFRDLLGTEIFSDWSSIFDDLAILLRWSVSCFVSCKSIHSANASPVLGGSPFPNVDVTNRQIPVSSFFTASISSGLVTGQYLPETSFAGVCF